jgi:pilus assembly protein TadC
MNLILIYILSFVATFALVLGILMPIFGVSKSLRQGDSRHVFLLSPAAPIIYFLVHLNSKMNLDQFYRNLEKKLILAGYPGGKLLPAEYFAIAQLIGISVSLFFLIIFTIAFGFNVLICLGCILIGVIFVWFAIEFLNNIKTSRNKLFSRQFPYFIDLAVMTMGSGASLLETIEIYLESNPGKKLSQELMITMSEMKMGKTTKDALEHFNERIVAEEVKDAIRSLLLGMKMGTPLGQVLVSQAEIMRFKRSQLAERAAEELKVRVMGPVMLMMIAIFILILGPAFIEVSNSGIG